MDKLNLVFGIVATVKNWPTYFLDYFGVLPGKENPIYVLPGGAKLICRRKVGDRATINEVWIRRLYHPTAEFDVSDGDTVIDIGGHIGVFSIYAGLKAKNGKVYVFEPHPGNFKQLEQNIKLNDLKNVFAFNYAVSGKRGKASLNVAPNHTAGHSTVMKQSDDYVEVNCLSLSDLIKDNSIKKIHFLKMDCEGGEYEIFQNTPKETFELIDIIAMETHENIKGHMSDEIVSMLEKNNFKVFRKGNMLFASRK